MARWRGSSRLENAKLRCCAEEAPRVRQHAYLWLAGLTSGRRCHARNNDRHENRCEGRRSQEERESGRDNEPREPLRGTLCSM